MIIDERPSLTLFQRIKAIYNDWKMDLVQIGVAVILSGLFYLLIANWGR